MSAAHVEARHHDFRWSTFSGGLRKHVGAEDPRLTFDTAPFPLLPHPVTQDVHHLSRCIVNF